jgi:Na+/H+-dicarboxylate symporter
MGSAGSSLGTAVRLLTSKRSKNMMSGLFAGGSAMFSSFGRVMRLLMLQVVGFLFLVIAATLGSKTWHEYQAYTAMHTSPSRFYVAGCFFLLFLYFGLSSFWRARK